MAMPTGILTGWTATLYAQPTANPVPLTKTEMGSQNPTDAADANSKVTAIVANANLVPCEAVPPYGYDHSEAAFGLAGSHYGQKIPTQVSPKTMELTIAYDPSNTVTNLLQGDAVTGLVDRTYVVSLADGAGNAVYYSFIGRISVFSVDAQPSAEAKATITLVPIGGGNFGWSHNATTP